LIVAISLAIETHRQLQRRSAAVAEIAGLMRSGQKALDDNDADVAYGRFLSAWRKVQSDPSLIHYQLGVAGWVDHSRRAVLEKQWRQRVPPREFDERRDEALLLSSLLESSADQLLPIAHEAIRMAFNLTLPQDPGWTAEREQLTLVENDLIEYESGAGQALMSLDSSNEFSSRLFHERRAELLQHLDRYDDAERAWHKANQYPPDPTVHDLLSGVTHSRRREFDAARADFERVLDRQPESFLARLYQAICFLHLNRAGEAKVGLTACIAQRPNFMWSHYFRSQACSALGDETGCIADLQRVLDSKVSSPLERAATAKMNSARSQ
jgi:tetratricopeptide (TPR) repeat protein